ncbi:hypothetical protein G7Y89_g13484 [Cudoniella acicularis]|uniref:Polyketide synthase n=1 Tax=Cudoniella acicularis TaxID=354080 RepID=A0A8H4VW04_9HELO|nr:hypothetical protein G7Y89_g13484 [Cudoniella acicularis]
MEPIAIIGLSLKFPQDAVSADDFWQLLVEGRSAVTEVPSDRFNINAFYHPDTTRTNTINVRGGHFIRDDITAFDAPFFSITPAEASCIEPIQRGLLESTYKALENAGILLSDLANSKTSVHVRSFTREYETILLRDVEKQAQYMATGTGTAMLANRLSWFFNLVGPSISIDTACSSSLLALHLACQSIRCGESSIGIVAGYNLFYNPDLMIPIANLNFLSPDSKCYSFDDRANGYSRGEGFGVVVIKSLSAALRDGNTIRAVIGATGTNQDGRTPGLAQETLIRETYSAGGLDLKETRYFEAHGTGTPAGDPLEAAAIGAVFRSERSGHEPLFVGALKSNIGHLAGASGIAGLIKSVLVLERGIIPPNIWFERPNPRILTKKWNIKFPLEPTPWPTEGLRRASVNSFGYGGSNVHVVLDDTYHYLAARNLTGSHCTVTTSPPKAGEIYRNGIPGHIKGSLDEAPLRLLVWSASDEGGIERLADVYHEYLASLGTQDIQNSSYFANLIYTLSAKRNALSWKSFAIAGSLENLKLRLEVPLPKAVRSTRVPKLAFVFTGQGAQHHTMGTELLVYSTFRDSLQHADTYFRSIGCEWGVVDELRQTQEQTNVHKPALSQPLYTTLQVALVDLLRSWNINPSSVSYLIAFERTELERVKIRVGCVNSPRNITLTGDEGQLERLKLVLDKERIFAQKLNRRTSSLGANVLYCLWRGNTSLSSSKADYWVENLTSPVLFVSAVTAMMRRSERSDENTRIGHLVEIGPHSALQAPLKEILKSLSKDDHVDYSSLMLWGYSALETALSAAGRLFCGGYNVDLIEINNMKRNTQLPNMLTNLPEYPFNHSHTYWHESRLSTNFRFRQNAPYELITLYPASGILVMAIEALRQLSATADHIIKGYKFKEVLFMKAVQISEEPDGLETNFLLSSRNNDDSFIWYDFRLYTNQNNTWVENCRGQVGVEYKESQDELGTSKENDLETAGTQYLDRASRCDKRASENYFYQKLGNSGLNFGPCFQTLHDLSYNDNGEACSTISLRDWAFKIPGSTIAEHVIHPTTLDGIFQTIFVGLSKGGNNAIPTLVPIKIREMWLSNALLDENLENRRIRICSKSVTIRLRDTESDIIALDDLTGSLRISISGLQATAIADPMTLSQPAHKLCFQIESKPDLDLLTGHKAVAYCSEIAGPIEDTDKTAKEVELAYFLSISSVLAKVSKDMIPNSKPHLLKYFNWLNKQLERYDSGEIIHGQPEWAKLLSDPQYQESLFRRVEDSNPEGKACITIHNSLEAILRGEVDALALIFDGTVLDDYYHWGFVNGKGAAKIAAYLDALAHNNPDLAILEIGAGTGSGTDLVVDAMAIRSLSEPNVARYSQYTFTDISPSFFEKAKDRFLGRSTRMDFKVLDICQDPAIQGFEDASLKNARKLMKPCVLLSSILFEANDYRGAKLMLFELTTPALLRSGFIFGLLPAVLKKRRATQKKQRVLRSGTYTFDNDKNSIHILLVARQGDEVVYRRLGVAVILASSLSSSPKSMPGAWKYPNQCLIA